MPKAEKLKSKLLEKYKKEYAQFLIEQENERKLAEEAKEKVSSEQFVLDLGSLTINSS